MNNLKQQTFVVATIFLCGLLSAEPTNAYLLDYQLFSVSSSPVGVKYVRDVAVGDVNGDNNLDMVAVYYISYNNCRARIFFGDGNGSFTGGNTYYVGSDAYSIELYDVNGDNALDIVVTNRYPGYISVLLGYGNGTFGYQRVFSVGRSPYKATLGDLNNDGELDIVVANRSDDNVSVLLGAGNGYFGAQTMFDVGEEPRGVSLGDLNVDGALDLVVANMYSDNISVLLGNGDGTFGQQVTYQVGRLPELIALADLNEDGVLDIVTVSYYEMWIFDGLGDGSFVVRDVLGAGLRNLLEIADVTGDDHLDILVGRSHDSLEVLFGTGEGSFPCRIATEVEGLGQAAIGDLNNDGAIDLVANNYYTTDVSVLLNQGPPMWHSYHSVTTGSVEGIDAVQFHFPTEMNQSSFSLADDISSFMGPQGSVAATGYSWVDPSTLEVTFETQIRFGTCQMVIGPDILDSAGQSMDLDGDLTFGEVPDDQYVATFNIVPSLRWSMDVWIGGYEVISPALARDGTVYVANPYFDMIYAINPNDGAIEWSFYGEDGISGFLAVGDDGTIYATSWWSTLYAINPNGTLKWSFESPGYFDYSYQLYDYDSGLYSMALGDDGTIYVLDWYRLEQMAPPWEPDPYYYYETIEEGTKIYALSPDGTLRWSHTVKDDELSGLAIGSDGVVYALGWWGGAYAINPDGSSKWSLWLPNEGWWDSPPAIGEDGIIYGVADADAGLALQALSADGTLWWSFPLDAWLATPPVTADDGTIYVAICHPDQYYAVEAINPDGTSKWSFSTGYYPSYSGSSPSIGAPAIGEDGTIYLAVTDNRVFAVNPDGSLKWSRGVPGSIHRYCAPAIAEDGTIYVVGSRVHAVNGESGGLPDSGWPMFGHDAQHTSWAQGLICHLPRWRVAGPVNSIRFIFRNVMDETTFSLLDDILSFVGPQDAVTTASYTWVNSQTLEVMFEDQTLPGAYEMVIGPAILDSGGNAMDLDRDSVSGEIPDDQYAATFIIEAPKLVSHSPSGQTDGPVQSIRFNFDHEMDETSFSILDDIVSFTSPSGSVNTNSYSWVDSRTLEVAFEPQMILGEYEIVVGPDILDSAGNAMDQDSDLLVGEVLDDRYKATFLIPPLPNKLFDGEQFRVTGTTQPPCLGDLNNDGALDIVIADSGNYTVSVLLGIGDGTFTEQTTYAVGRGPYSVSLGDVQGDHVLDIVTANRYDNTISVLLGHGDGTFMEHTEYNVGDGPVCVSLGDLNGDSALDVVTANNGDTASVLLGNGDGTFTAQPEYQVGDSPLSVSLGDLNKDGTLDIVTANAYDDTVSILLGNGDGAFATAKSYAVGDYPLSVSLGDLNNDELLDIVTVNQRDDTLSVLLGNGDGTFPAPLVYAVGNNPGSVCMDDLDGDDMLDVVALLSGGQISVLLGKGDGSLTEYTTFDAGNFVIAISLGDINGDAALDLVTMNYRYDAPHQSLSVLLGNGEGTFATNAGYSAGNNPASIATGDLDGDNLLDVVTANSWEGSVSVLLGLGEGRFASPVTCPVTGSPSCVSCGDLNADGALDIITGNSEDTVFVLLGNGDGTFVPHAHHPSGDNPVCIALGDLNGDAVLDIVTANEREETISVLLGKGDGTFTEQSTYGVGRQPHSVGIGDLNGDGTVDVVTANSYNDTVSVLFGNGDGTFEEHTVYRVGPEHHRYWYGYEPWAVSLGDLNSDGALDIVTANRRSRNISVLLGHGDGTFEDYTTFNVWFYPFSILLGDFNGDGALDVVTGNYSHNISVVLGNGNGTFTEPGIYGTGYGPWAIAAGDVDNDGAFDIVTANYFADTISVLIHRREVFYSPCGETAAPVSAIQFRFRTDMNPSSFSVMDDVTSFVGPQGEITIEGDAWLDAKTLEVTFKPQTVVGRYEMVIGPHILDVSGNPMDFDSDSIRGEVPDDQCRATFTIVGPRLTRHSPSLKTAGPVNSICLGFDHDMNETSFSLDDDIVSFTGPEGPLTASNYAWVTSRTLELTFESQSTVGAYEVVIGPEILDVAGNSMDQDRDAASSEIPDDQYTANFTIKGPRVTGHVPAVATSPPLDSIRFNFDHDMNETSFSLAEDIVSFTGPEGPIVTTDYYWVDSRTLEIKFEPQYLTGSAYEMVIGPDILDIAGNTIDQDGDLILAEVPDDQYAAAIGLAYSGSLTEDKTWGPERGPILVDGTLSVERGVTLTIEPGTVVKFTNNARIDVAGSIEVLNTSEEPVILTSSQDNSAGGDTSTGIPTAGDWQGIRLDSSGATATLQNVEIRYANKAIHGNAALVEIRLKNCVLRDGQFGIYVYTAYVDIIAENCLIADNTYSGVFVRATSREVLRNCTIVGNGFLGSSDRYAAGIHLGAADLTLDNCIVAFNRNGLHHSGDPPVVTARHCDFYNPAGQEIIWNDDPGIPHLNENGNITEDPLFVDYDLGNYELADWSPAIDAGRGIQAPVQDILGRDRHDDCGTLNTGTGYPSYVDMGAYERQLDTPACDLAVTSVSSPSPEFVSAGDPFMVEWTVTNIATLECNGPWQDVVYMSDDPYISPDDLVLEERDHSESLSPGASYTETLTMATPDTSGPKYILVRTDADSTVPEIVTMNNLASSSHVLGVDIPLLQIGTPKTGSASGGQWNYYRFEGEPGHTVLFSFEAEASGCQIYLRRDIPPTLSAYDVSGVALGPDHHEMRLLEPLEGTYYVGVYGQQFLASSSDYVLFADLTTLEIREVTPSVVGNAGSATIKIIGDDFHPDTQVQMTGPSGTFNSEVYYQDSITLFATFDLAGQGTAPGPYNVIVTNPDLASVTAYDAITIQDGGMADFRAYLTMPGIARPGRVIELGIRYTNPSTIDVPSPILTLDSGVYDCEWQLPGSDRWIVGPDFRVMALNPDGPATALRPGQTESITVRLRIPFRPDDIAVTLSSVGATATDGSSNPIDWNQVESEIRPVDVNSAIWDPVFAQLQAQIGETWGDYAQVLRANANRWFAAGRRVYCVRELFRMEMVYAWGLPTGIITGKVKEANTGLPVSNVIVRASHTGLIGSGEGVTDEDGFFYLYGLEPGLYRIAVTRNLVQSGETLELIDGEDLIDAEVLVTEAGHISGGVTSAVDSQAITNALVHATGITTGFSQFTMTDQYGLYELGELSADTYIIRCTAEVYAGQVVEDVAVVHGSTTSVNFDLEIGATLTGTVTASEDGTPIENAEVVAVAENGLVLGASSDGQGEYLISGIPSGVTTVHANAVGRIASDAVEVVVTAPESFTQNFALIPAATIAGAVVDSTGQPIIGALVTASSEAGFGVALTDHGGNYLVDGLDAGTYSMQVSAGGHVSQTVTDVMLEEGQAISGFDFLLDAGSVVRGTVTEADSIKPIEGTRVLFKANAGPQTSCSTEDDGTFSTTLLPGNYYVRVEAKGYVISHRMLEVPDGSSVDNLDFFLVRGVTIHGKVVMSDGITAIPNTVVQLLDGEGKPVESDMTDNNGQYTLDHVPCSSYVIVAIHPSYSFEYGELNIQDPGEVIHDISAAMGQIYGTITSQQMGVPVEGATVKIVSRSDSLYYAVMLKTTTAADGSYSFDSLADGNYLVIAEANGLGRVVAEHIVSSANSSQLDFQLASGYSLSGTITTLENGNAVSGTYVWIRNTLWPNDDPGLDAITDEAGTYLIDGLSPGEYRIYAYAEEHIAQQRDEVISSNMTLNLSLGSEGYNLMGSIIDGDSLLPLAGAWLVLERDGYPPIITQSESNGGFEFAPLAPAQYHISAAFSEVDNTFDITVDGDLSIVLELALGSGVGGVEVASLPDYASAVTIETTLLSGTAITTGGLVEIGESYASVAQPQPTDLDELYETVIDTDALPMVFDIIIWPPTYPMCPKEHLTTYVNLLTEKEDLIAARTALKQEYSEIQSLAKQLEEHWNSAQIRAKVICGTQILSLEVPISVDSYIYANSPAEILKTLVSDVTNLLITVFKWKYRVLTAPITILNIGTAIYQIRAIMWELYAEATELYWLEEVYKRHVDNFEIDYESYEDDREEYEEENEPCDDEPDNDDEKQDEGDTDVQTSGTPEDKFGLAGYDALGTPEGSEMHYVPAGQTMEYRIEFWNKEDAPVPTQDAIIEDVLDPDIFELETFEFTRFGFLAWDVPLPGGQAIDTRVDLRPEMDIAVDVNATFDPETGRIFWWFHCVDPMTGDWPEDPLVGFLPPYNPETGFEIGWVEFRVRPKPGLPSGTQIANQAFVEFDFLGDLYEHPAPKEGPWINTIDAEAPSSHVLPLPAVPPETDFTVAWTGQDDIEGSGIMYFDIYVSIDGGEYLLWLSHVSEVSAMFSGEDGHSYAFYSVAYDNVGNVEHPPTEPDAVTAFNRPPVANAGPDQNVGCAYNTEQGINITLNGTNSSDPDGNPLAYTWTGPFVENPVHGPSPTVTLLPGCPGDYIITLIVNDGTLDSFPDEVVVTVQDITATLMYDGDTLVSTQGNPTVAANLVATLRDEIGDVLDINDANVMFTLSAEGIESETVTTSLSQNGVAQTLQVLEPAIYKIEMTLDCSEIVSTAILVVYNPEGGFATGGGWIVPEVDGLNTHPNVRANFGFNARYKQDSPTGHIEFRYSDGYIDLKSSSIERLVITGGKIVQFKGWASVNKEQGHWFFVKAIDNGEPGTNNDTFEIKVWAPGVDIEGDPTERAGGVLQGGNIVVHAKE